MLKQLFEYVHRLLDLAQETRRNRGDIDELRRELQRTNGLLIELSNKLERLAEREHHEREKFVLKVENALLRSDRLLPPPAGPKKRK